MNTTHNTPDAKDAVISLSLKADSGFRSAGDYRVSANLYARILAVCEDGPQGKAMAVAPELLQHLQRLVNAIGRLPGNNPLEGLADEAREVIALAGGNSVESALANMLADIDEEAVYQNYTRSQLEAAFKQVQNKEHWKNPIQTNIPADSDRALFTAAIIYFTGSVPEFLTNEDGTLTVTASGYYQAIGA